MSRAWGQWYRVTGSGVCTEVSVAGCSPLEDENREERKTFSSLKGLHDTSLTCSLLLHTHTRTRTHFHTAAWQRVLGPPEEAGERSLAVFWGPGVSGSACLMSSKKPTHG